VRRCFRDEQLPNDWPFKEKFSIDFMKRCTAEYDTAAKKYRSDREKLVII
jgi:hypothetical protein